MQSEDGHRFLATSGNLFYELAELPVYTGAQFVRNNSEVNVSSPPVIRVTTSVNDHAQNVKRNSVKHVFVSPEEEFATPSQDQSDAIASYVSPSGQLLVVLREAYSDESHGKKRFVEVWSGDALKNIQDVTGTHGVFYADEVFASYGFDKEETRFVYTAEANAESSPASPADGMPFDNFRFAAPLGEKFIGKKRPAFFVFRWDLPLDTLPPPDSRKGYDYHSGQTLTSIVGRVDPQNFQETVRVSFGQATFDEAGDSIFATGYEHLSDGRFPGIVGCHNRPSAIWNLTRDSHDFERGIIQYTPKRLTPKDRSCRSPRYIKHDGKDLLIYLLHEVNGPHHSSAQLRVLDLQAREDKILVDTVWEPDVARDQFPGLYLDQLPRRPFLVLGGRLHVLLHSLRTHYSTVYRVCVETGACTPVVDQAQQRGHVFSWTVLDTDGARRFLCMRSRTDVPNQLVLGAFSPEAEDDVHLRVIDKPLLSSRVSMALDRLCQTTYTLAHKPHVESIVIETINEAADENEGEKVNPAIMIPHGGPHNCSTNAFNPTYAALALEKYTLYLPNYTGSLGYGMKHVKDLLGKCGDIDIQDCIDMTKGLINKGVIKEGIGRQFVYGGSHGGFIAAHLIGQYPTFFSAAILRNPVINAGEMVALTDIPDWCYSEFGLKGTARLDSAGYAYLFRNSPSFHAQDIIAPVMLLLGEQDQRVPPSQGRNLYHLLKGKGTPVDMLCFPGKGHSLEQVESTRMSFEAIRWWLAKYRI